MTAQFQLQFAETDLSGLAEQYRRETGEREQRLENAAFEAGAAIRNGDFSLVNLEPVVRWKSEHAVHYLIGNSSESIRRALALVVSPEASPREAVGALLALHGVDLPVASAILTAIFPERYTVMDWQVLEALGYPRQDERFYEEFLGYCQQVAASAVPRTQEDGPGAMPLRTLDRALRQWSEEQSEPVPEVRSPVAA
jgi:hypothetical protein